MKDKDKPEDRQGVVYKIKCCDCQASYIGGTGRNLSTRLTEHKRATRNGDVNNHIAEHHFKDETSNRLGLCDMYNVFYRLTSVTVDNNSPVQDYVQPHDQTQFKPFTVFIFLCHSDF